MKPARTHHPRAALTLVELLLGITLLAILAALAAPALARARNRVQGAVCSNHLRQWGLATHLYTLDHDDFLPPDGTPNPGPSSTNQGWYIALPRQLGLAAYHTMPWRTNPAVNPGPSIWLCPSNTRRSNGRNLFHYCLNEHVNGTGENDRPVRLTPLQEPASLVWLFDSKNLPAVGDWSYVHTNLHARGAQFLFLDGHVARFQQAASWDPVTGRARTNHPALRWIP
ncbi:MAG TPA: hypothetical protein PKM73_07850 [Verrucomicrobiota bacterium]|nr:hypothetical protein [Verrucomicrobiota bacterium]HNU51744.1 hypothetical protein [Verrucomicrobiota bacterium]